MAYTLTGGARPVGPRRRAPQQLAGDQELPVQRPGGGDAQERRVELSTWRSSGQHRSDHQ